VNLTGVVQWQRLTLSKGYNRVGASPHPLWPEDGNRSSFRNVVFSSFKNTGPWTKSENPVILRMIEVMTYRSRNCWRNSERTKKGVERREKECKFKKKTKEIGNKAKKKQRKRKNDGREDCGKERKRNYERKTAAPMPSVAATLSAPKTLLFLNTVLVFWFCSSQLKARAGRFTVVTTNPMTATSDRIGRHGTTCHIGWFRFLLFWMSLHPTQKVGFLSCSVPNHQWPQYDGDMSGDSKGD
jgi:hypothetical protein